MFRFTPHFGFMALSLAMATASAEAASRRTVHGSTPPAPAATSSTNTHLDPVPAPPTIAPPTIGVVQQAGIGGSEAYSRAGVVELGGSLDFTKASDITTFSFRPSVGYFFMDNWEVTGMVGYHHSSGSNVFSALVEPSMHIPFTPTIFGFAGMGFGLAASTGKGAGAALAPRVGMNILVGRSGILTPELHFIYYTNQAVQTAQGSVLTVSSIIGLGAGYTVMW